MHRNSLYKNITTEKLVVHCSEYADEEDTEYHVLPVQRLQSAHTNIKELIINIYNEADGTFVLQNIAPTPSTQSDLISNLVPEGIPVTLRFMLRVGDPLPGVNNTNRYEAVSPRIVSMKSVFRGIQPPFILAQSKNSPVTIAVQINDEAYREVLPAEHI